ncbi:MAG: dUTP diphosphatase [Candidatus Eremiobacteraeota bacterium]|nr:dUTP diphosphatase [Candidatus Eremiobacteraeota bacterium]MBV8280449.1 dUTP diphosphatase [Candidatus Eremiobacteraeota bacterium]
MDITVEISVLPEGAGLPLPEYMSADAAGCDVLAAVREDVVLAPGERALVSAGFCMALPAGYEAQVRPRSGLALKHGVTLLNAPGTIDADYRGPVSVILINHGDEPFVIRRGDRIAQLIVAPVQRARFAQRDALAATERGAGGFGSTGQGSKA